MLDQTPEPTDVPHIKLDVTKPTVWAAFAYASIRGGESSTMNRTAALEVWREKGGALADLEYEPDILEDEMEEFLYDRLEKYPVGFYLSAGDYTIYIHADLVRGLQ